MRSHQSHTKTKILPLVIEINRNFYSSLVTSFYQDLKTITSVKYDGTSRI